MAAITGIVSTGIVIPLGSGAPGSLWAEIWRLPASTAADTQTITSNFLSEIKSVMGPVSHTALPLTAKNTAALITSVTVAASNFIDFFVIGIRAAG